MTITRSLNIEAPAATVPEGKRVPFGWSAFAVPRALSTSAVVLSWPEAPGFKAGARLRITVALDVRENKLVEVRSAQTDQLLGTFDIRFASICQPFEITLAPDKAQLAIREGVRLQMARGEAALWLFDGQGGAPDEFAPRWVEELEAGDQWAQFDQRICSLASVQAFGWIEGCVLDGLWQMARTGQPRARAALDAHLKLFVSPGGDLDYEGPGSNPLHNALYGMESLLPFAIIAQIMPESRVLNLATDFCQKHHDAQGAVADGNTTTEGVYIVGYPLAVMGKARQSDELMHLALLQLRARRERNVQGETIFQAMSSDGVGRLPNWARGVAWYLLGFARVLDVLNPGAEAADLYAEFKRAATWAMQFQQPSGLWHNFLDDANSIADTSGSAGIATALALGARRGWLPDSARAAAASTCRALEAHLTPDGFLGGMAQFNKGGEELQRSSYRVMAPMAMGLAAQLRAELGTARATRILLRGSWRTQNIGDVAHTPGVLQILREHLPHVQVTLWPTDIGHGVEEMLLRNFPALRIARSKSELKAAFDECDFLLHGSATSLARPEAIEQWQRETGKPYGVYGITLAPEGDKAQALIFNSGLTASQRLLLNGARFLFLRDGVSLQFAREAGITSPVVEFGPDSAFGTQIRDEARASAFLSEHRLQDGQFLCVIPRLRNTPFWGADRAPQSDFDKAKHAVNEEFKEADFAKLRAAIIAFVRETGLQVLVCPECDDHMSLGREMIVERLPADVRAKTVWRQAFWLPDEAAGVYARALALLSMDMHSPILAVANGTPAIVCRWWQQTSKGFMWRDIGLGEWLFDLDEERDGANITQAVLSIAREPSAARAKVAAAMALVRQRQRATMAVLARELSQAARPSVGRAVVEKMPGLVAFWTFGEEAGQPRQSSGTLEKHPLLEVGGPIARVEGGPFSGYSAELNGEQYLKIPHAQARDLNISGLGAQVSMFAVVRIVDLHKSRTIAGMWSEGRGRDDDSGTRQYALLMNMPTYGGPRQLTPHISSEGGLTRRTDGSAFPWCADYAATTRQVPEEEWCTLGFTYDGQFIRAYINGAFEERPLNAVPDKRDDPYFTREGPDGGGRGMNPFFHGRGIFGYDPARHAESKPSGGSDFTVGARYAVGSMLGEATRGKFGGLAVFNRALSDEEIRVLHDAAGIEALG